ncbi:hypothetical protein [Cribrihabitans neustonicus]|uniref:hypothetical protein n=1 Tax=Cribrihabitans neustonicus TaxID=1429085 RepID=UPI003B58CE2F
MPLPLLLALVAGGITAIAALLHLTGRSQRAVLDAASARQAWLRHDPEAAPGEILVNAAQDAALLLPCPSSGSAAPGFPGLVWSFGADTAARSLEGARISPAPAGLRAAFADFAAPGLTITLTEQERAAWLARLPAASLSPDCRSSFCPPSTPAPSSGARA